VYFGGNVAVDGMSRQSSSSVRHLTVRCVVSLGVLALLAVLGQAFVQGALQQTANDAALINSASRQRMLSQKISKSVLAIELANMQKNAQARRHYVTELRTTLIQWREAQQGLQDDAVPPGIVGKNSAVVKRLFATLEPHYLALFNASSTLLVCFNAARSPSKAMIAAPVQSVLAEEPLYLVTMDNIVAQYQHEAEGRVQYLTGIELLLLVVTVGVLCFEGFFVFRLALHRVRTEIAE